MSRPIPHPKVKPSSEWIREAPEGATALIVAECTAKGQTLPQRRVALGWLYGDRNKPAPLREAAARLPETASLADSTSERKESDGSIALMSSERCHVRWTVRSIPLSILICWTGFEDEFAKPVPAEAAEPAAPKPAISDTPPQATQQPAIKQDQQPSTITAPRERPTGTKSATPQSSTDPIRSDGADTNTPGRKLTQFAPLEALIVNPKAAFAGNCAAPDCKFITDGRALLLRSACDQKFLQKLKAAKCGLYGPENPAPEATMQKLFDATIADTRYAAQISGYVLGASIGKEYDAEEPLVCIAGPGERITIANGHRLKFIQKVTGASTVKTSVDPKSQRVLVFKGEQPVAVLMAVESPSAETVFRQMLHTRNPVTHLRPESTTARKAS